MEALEIILLISLTIIACIMLFFIRLYVSEHRQRIEAMKRKETGAYQAGVNRVVGDYSQILGTFHVLTEYDEIMMLSSTSRQSTLDLIGMKDDQLDFIEFKKDGANLSAKEKKIKRLIDSNQLKIQYRIVDVKLPEGTQILTRNKANN